MTRRDWSDAGLRQFAELGEEVYGACCPTCGVRYNDWFRDGHGNRYCWPCWAGFPAIPEPPHVQARSTLLRLYWRVRNWFTPARPPEPRDAE